MNDPIIPRATYTQVRVMQFLRQHKAQKGYMPSGAEISAHFCWNSANSAFENVRALVKRGFLLQTPGTARALSFTPLGLETLGHGTEAQQESVATRLITLPVVGMSINAICGRVNSLLTKKTLCVRGFRIDKATRKRQELIGLPLAGQQELWN